MEMPQVTYPGKFFQVIQAQPPVTCKIVQQVTEFGVNVIKYMGHYAGDRAPVTSENALEVGQPIWVC